jgi:hypothetical protein
MRVEDRLDWTKKRPLIRHGGKVKEKREDTKIRRQDETRHRTKTREIDRKEG